VLEIKDGRRQPSGILFSKFKFSLAIQVGTPMHISVPNFIEIGQTVEEILRLTFFSKQRPSTILDF